MAVNDAIDRAETEITDWILDFFGMNKHFIHCRNKLRRDRVMRIFWINQLLQRWRYGQRKLPSHFAQGRSLFHIIAHILGQRLIHGLILTSAGSSKPYPPAALLPAFSQIDL